MRWPFQRTHRQADGHRPWKALRLPRELAAIRSMLTEEEKRYLTWLGQERFEGWGAVIDLGAWLGGSSAALAEGIRRAGRSACVQSFDRFLWEEEPQFMAAIAGEHRRAGTDFLDLFLREIGTYHPWIAPRRQDLLDFRWTEGPIELLFVDAAKSWELANAIVHGFGPSLVPGRSRVILQDFRFHETYWLPLIFDSRPDLWEEVESVDDGPTAPFKALDGPVGVHDRYEEAGFPPATLRRILQGRVAREAPQHATMFRRMLYRAALADGRDEEATALRNELERDGTPRTVLDQLSRLEHVLVPRGWRSFDQGDFASAREIAERCVAGRAPRPVYALGLLGLSHLRLGNVAAARESIAEVWERLPGIPDAWLYRAELALAEHRPMDARADIREAVRLGGPSPRHVVPYALGLLEQARREDGDQAAHLATLEEMLVLSNEGKLLREAVDTARKQQGDQPR